MLSIEAAALVIGATRGLIKLSGRLDVLFAEKEAVTGALAIPMNGVAMPQVSRATKIEMLQKYLDETSRDAPDPLHRERAAIADLLRQASDLDEIDRVFGRIFPSHAGAPIIDPDAEFLKALRSRMPTLDLDHPDTQLACFYCAAGRDERQLGYPARTALLAADVLAEFGAENAFFLVRDENASRILQSVLERIAKPQLEDFTEWSPLLRETLGATADGLLANPDALDGAGPWVDALLAALAMTRDDPNAGEDFVIGLVRSKGYRKLISAGLLIAGERLSRDAANSYKQVAADVLRAIAPVVKQGGASFNEFFHDNWGELMCAGLASVERYGPGLLEGEKPIVREATVALVGQLARTPNTSLLSGETLYGIANAVIGAVAAKPELLDPSIREPWLNDLVASLAKVSADQRLQKSLTRDGLRESFRAAAMVLGRHPELLADKPAERVQLISAVLRSVSAAGTVDAKTLATSAVSAVLAKIGERPDLLDTRYAEILSAFSGQMAKLVASNTLTSVQASDVINAAAEAVLRNPLLFEKFEGNLATAVVSGVLKGAKSSDVKLLAGTALVDLLGETLRIVALRGRDLVETTSEKELVDRISAPIRAGLVRAEKELGRQLDVVSVPLVLAGLVAAVARGEITEVHPDDPKFTAVFAMLAEAAVLEVARRRTTNAS